MSGGLLGFGDPAADKKTADDYGVTPEMLSAQRYSTLGNIGAILLAAAQPGPIGQRGQIMAKLADVSGNAASGLKDAVAARMNGIKLKEAQADLARKAQLREMVANDTTLTPEQKSWAIANPEGYFQARGQSQLNVQQAKDQQTALMPGQLDYARQVGTINRENAVAQETALAPVRTKAAVDQETALAPVRTQSAIQQEEALAPLRLKNAERMAIVQSQAPYEAKVAQLVQSGVPEDVARGMASGRFVTKELKDADSDATRFGVVDVSTGKELNPPAPRAALNPDQASIVSAMPTTGAGGKPLDYSEATGGAGMAKNAWNIISSNITGQPTFADADKAKQALEQLNTRTMTSLTAEIPGRETNQMREQLAGMGVKTGSVFQPDAMAFTKLSQTKQFIDSAITRQEAQLAEGGYSRSDRGKIRTNLGQLKQLQSEYDTVLTHFGNAGVGQQQPQQQGPAVGGTGGGGQGGATFKIIGVR